MKRCPECRRDYYDDTLLYCLDDGSALLEGPATSEAATAILRTDSLSGDVPTQVLGNPGTFEANRSGQAVSRKNSLIAGVIGIVIVTTLGIGSYLMYGRANTQINSVAVMPFVNESGNPDVEYLSDGMTETLISSLSQLPNLNVKARSSVFRYKGKETNPQAIGRELNVQAILNGRVVQRGTDLTLHVELVDTATENVLWKSDYSRSMTNLVSVQSEIARDVSTKLMAKLSGAEQNQIAKTYTENAEAYRLYLQGRFHWNKRKADEHNKAIQYFEQAIALDPNYALAYSGIADCYAVDTSPLPPAESAAKLRTAARKALELDPTLGEPHAALANVYWSDWDWDGAEREFKLAIELNPQYPTAHQWYAEMLTRLGRHDEAIAEIRRAQELDPLSMVINSDMIYILAMARRYDESIDQAKKTLQMDKNWNQARNELILIYEFKGLFEEALTATESYVEFSDLSPEKKASLRQEIAKTRDGYRKSGAEGYWRQRLEFEKEDQSNGSVFSPSYMGELCANAGDKDEAFKWLSKAVDEKEGFVDLMKVNPGFDNLRADPRFAQLLRRMNLSL